MRPRVAAVLALFFLAVLVAASCGQRESPGSAGEPGNEGPPSSAPAAGRSAGLQAASRAAQIAARQARAPGSYDFTPAPVNKARAITAVNPANQMAVEAADGRVHVSGALGAARWTTMLRWARLGRGGALTAVESASGEAAITRNRLAFSHGAGQRSWYVNGELGVEQGFDIDSPPPGDTSGEPLVIEVAVEGDLVPVVQANGARIELALPSGETAAWYDELHASDAEGQGLPARMEVADGAIHIVVDDSEAVYPVVVDPLIWWQTQKLTGSGSQKFGSSLGLSQDGSRLFVGNLDGGSVYVYRFDALSGPWGQWVDEGTLQKHAGCDSVQFGWAVAIDGSIAIVGDPSNDAICVYRYNAGAWAWAETVTGQEQNVNFGAAVAIRSSQVMVRDWQPNGKLWSYTDNGSSLVGAVHYPASSWAPVPDQMPRSLAMDGAWALVVDQDTIDNRLAFYNYSASWTTTQTIPIGPPYWLSSVGIGGDLAIAGLADSSVKIYRRSGGNWGEDADLVPSAAQGGSFGWSVAVADSTAVVGAPQDDSITVYRYSQGLWSALQKITMVAGGHAGNVVAVGINGIVAGAPNEVINATTTGAVYIFKDLRENGDACSAAAQCISGFCADGVCCNTACGGGDTNDCQACSQGAGAPSNGTCASRANWSGCSDGNACTQTDTCQNGTCTGANPKSCPVADSCHNASTCDTATGVCSTAAKTDGTACNDGNACTQTDTCLNGTCTGASPKTCPTPDQCHSTGTCDGDTGLCSYPPKADNAACSDGNACTQSDTCQNGACTSGSPKACSALDQCHSAGACDPATGACSNPAKDDSASCDDGNAATTDDHCSGGVCVGSQPQCSAAGDCPTPANPCLAAACSGGQCGTTSKNNGTSCSDGNACTQTDTCQNGTCTGANPKVCPTPDQCHDPGTCDPATGQCSNPAKAVGVPCNDGDLCTQNDTCQNNGACQAGSAVVCVAPDACHSAGTCAPATGECFHPVRLNGTPCNDGDLCTQNDTCQGGTCTGGAGVTCAALPCQTAACNPGTGCVYTPAPNNTSCSDGNACTQADKCQSGACVPGVPVTCQASDPCHDPGACNPATGACSTGPARPDDTPCTDGDLCTQGEACHSGTCNGGAPIACPAGACQVGVCAPGAGCSVTPAAESSACNDGNPCTLIDKCQSGVCVGGNPKTCGAPDQCHDVGVCDPASGACVNQVKPDNTACNDGSACTLNDVCTAGACIPGVAIVCAAQDQCHDAGTCDSATGVCTNPNKANNILCNDGNACTQTDVCTNGVCTGTLPITCPPAGQCKTSTCDAATGACVVGSVADGTACNDGNACTATDTCQTGSCTGSDPKVCTASDQCHDAGTCNPVSGACSNPNKASGTACSDGSVCTQNDTCQSGTCAGGAAVTCPTSACHTASCDAALGCLETSLPDGTACNDGDLCTQTDKCNGGQCVGGNPKTCGVASQCQDAGVCDAATGMCVNPGKANGTPCNDGDACTLNDVCTAGACTAGSPVTCAASDQCHDAGTCNSATGVCSSPNKANNVLCDDGDACTQKDVCTSGVCVGSLPVVCGPAGQCGVAACDKATGVCATTPVADGAACDDGNPCTQTDSCQGGRLQGLVGDPVPRGGCVSQSRRLQPDDGHVRQLLRGRRRLRGRGRLYER